MNILFCIPKLEIGGAEVFLVRLVSYLKGEGHNCFIFETTEYAKPNTILKSQLTNLVPIYNLTGSKLFYRIIDKIDKTCKSNKCRKFTIRQFIKRVIRRHQIDIINTHVFSADYWVSQSLLNDNLPIAMTMHGCYEDININVQKAIQTLKRINAIIYIADKNLDFINERKINLSDKIVKKIYNGYSQKIDDSETLQRVSINCDKEDFIFIMVARGIPEKGWQTAINAFLKLNTDCPKTKLLLIGGGDYLESLETKNSTGSILFLGEIHKPQAFMRIADVGILPTQYKNESLPNSVTEYLYNQLPVIATNIGDIKKMISCNEMTAGIVINDMSDDNLFKAMKMYVTDRSLYIEHKELTREAVKKFDIKTCASEYIKVFNELISATTMK